MEVGRRVEVQAGRCGSGGDGDASETTEGSVGHASQSHRLSPGSGEVESFEAADAVEVGINDGDIANTAVHADGVGAGAAIDAAARG